MPAMMPVSQAHSRASSSAWHHHGLPGESGHPPPSQNFWVLRRETAASAVQRVFCTRADGEGKGWHRVQLLKCWWLHVQQEGRNTMGPGLTLRCLWQVLNPYCRSCSTVSTSTRKYLEFNDESSAVCYRNQLPANLISSSMATGLSTVNVFYPAVFPPAGIQEKFCIRTNIKNTRAMLDHFTGNRGHTWDYNVGVTLQKQQAIKQNNAASIRWGDCSKESLWCRKNFN